MLSTRLLLFAILFYCEFYSAFSGLRQEPMACCLMTCSSSHCDEAMDPADCTRNCARAMSCTAMCCIYLLPEDIFLGTTVSSIIAWVSPDGGKPVVNLKELFHPPESGWGYSIHV